MRRQLSIILVCALCAAVLPGCASKYGDQKTVVSYYPACYRPIQDLRDREYDVGKGTATGAAVGAIGGALLGLLASGGDWRGAAAGAAVGGVAGGVTGNIYASNQKEAEDTSRLAAYLQDIDGDISNMDVQAAAARTSLNCYDQQFKILVSEIKARKITRSLAQRRFTEIVNGREEAVNILGGLVERGSRLELQYEQAFMNEEQNLRTPQRTSQAARAGGTKARALTAARQKTGALKQKTQAIAREKLVAQNVSARNIQEMNEIMESSDLLENARI